jgi:hypothetical protein
VRSPVRGDPPGALLFDRPHPGRDRARRLFAAATLEATDWTALGALNVGAASYSVAVAHAARPYRYWFMNEQQEGGQRVIRLVTKLGEVGEMRSLRINLPGGCPAQGDDLAPWVTPDGRVLFFQAPYNAHGDCAQAAVLRSFYVRLGPDGLPADDRPATMLLPNLAPSIAVQTPSLSPDECSLFVASDRDGQQKIYSAMRR